jgi:hypothetical protein
MQTNNDLDVWEKKIESGIERDTSIPATDREAIIRVRRSQGIFYRAALPDYGRHEPVHLIARHCKYWRDSTDAERLNGENVLLLTPNIDHLFDRGFIEFAGSAIDAGEYAFVGCRSIGCLLYSWSSNSQFQSCQNVAAVIVNVFFIDYACVDSLLLALLDSECFAGSLQGTTSCRLGAPNTDKC